MSIPFKQVQPEENVNISKQSPLREFLKLFTGITVSVAVVYFFLGFAVDILVPFIPVSLEKKLGKLVVTTFEKQTRLGREKRVQAILDTLLPHLEHNSFDISISVAQFSRVNAVALPGGHIIIYEGLLKKISSERELAFVIGHEIGHFVNRDHLKGLGRRFSLVLMALILGRDNMLSSNIINSLNISERAFSRRQESKADAVGLELLMKAYGTTDGSVSFFRKLQEEGSVSDFAYFFSTHPSPQKRIAHLEMLIEKKYEN